MEKSVHTLDIHLAGTDDVHEFTALVHEMDNYYGTPIPETIDATAGYIIHAGIGPKAPIEALLARRDGTAIGFASFGKIFPSDDGRLGAHLKDLFIMSAARGQGVGGALPRALAKIRQERGYKRLIWTTTRDNHAALAFYDSLGAERRGEKLQYRLDGRSITQLSREE
jgi:ribosomal protein S18 acetylase RimI-like enzyme